MSKETRTRGQLLWHAFVETKWAVTKPMFQTIQQILANRRAGIETDAAVIAHAKAQREAREQAAAARREMAASSGNVYVVPVCGIITQRASMFTEYSGGCSVEDVVAEVREAMAMPSVAAVVLDIDSPGGSVYGVPEAFDALKAFRGTKPLVAFCNPMAASAAYWLAAACDSISCTPSGEAGSVGVYMSHTDYSGMNEKIGVDVTYISAGKFKVEGNPDAPLSTEAAAYYQKQVDDTYTEFVADVAEGRGVSTKDVIARFGEGRVLLAKDAIAAGMIDNICTFDELIQGLTSPASGRKGRKGAGLTSTRVASSGADDSIPDECDPDEDGNCPDGYEYDEAEDICRLVKAATPAEPVDEEMDDEAARDAAAVAVSASVMDMERRR